MTHARLRQFDAAVVYKLDRRGRSLVHCVTGIQELQSLGIRFVAISQGLGTDESNPTTKLLTHILASVAEFERSLIEERVSAGIKAAQAHGTRSGRPLGRVAPAALDYLVVAFVSCDFQSVLLCKGSGLRHWFLFVRMEVVDDWRTVRTKWHLQAP